MFKLQTIRQKNKCDHLTAAVILKHNGLKLLFSISIVYVTQVTFYHHLFIVKIYMCIILLSMYVYINIFWVCECVCE